MKHSSTSGGARILFVYDNAEVLSWNRFLENARYQVSAVSGCNFAATQVNFGNQGRNQFRGPGFFDTDMNVNKSFSMSENYRLTVEANIFNLLNHPNFANPDFDVTSLTFGQVLSTVSLPTSPYGAFVGAAASGRIIQLNARVTC